MLLVFYACRTQTACQCVALRSGSERLVQGNTRRQSRGLQFVSRYLCISLPTAGALDRSSRATLLLDGWYSFVQRVSAVTHRLGASWRRANRVHRIVAEKRFRVAGACGSLAAVYIVPEHVPSKIELLMGGLALKGSRSLQAAGFPWEVLLRRAGGI
jgi:hypothetical protein